MSNYRSSIVLVFMTALFGCESFPSFDDVLPDERTEYRRSTDLPPLEVPPDLTNTMNSSMAIPGEEEAVTLSEFQRQRAQATGATVLGKGEFDGEQWIALQASQADVWPELLLFWEQQGYDLDLVDQELGVMETDWNILSENNGAVRERFRIFAETGQEGETMLFLSSEQQLVTDGEWYDTQADVEREKKIIKALNLYFYGAEVAPARSASASTAAVAATKQRAQIMTIDSERSYLALPSEYSTAFPNTQTALERAGISIQEQSLEAGTYNIMYYNPDSPKEEGLLDKLKFWGDDEEGVPYQLSLTGVGDKTELIVNDAEGNWASNEDAQAILETLLRYYNQL